MTAKRYKVANIKLFGFIDMEWHYVMDFQRRVRATSGAMVMDLKISLAQVIPAA